MQNLEWISNLKKSGQIDKLYMAFVVHKLNYKDMPDFVKLADAFGLKGERVTTVQEFEKAFSNAYKANAPYIIDTVIDMDEFVLPMLPPGGSIEDIITEKQTTV